MIKQRAIIKIPANCQFTYTFYGGRFGDVTPYDADGKAIPRGGSTNYLNVSSIEHGSRVRWPEGPIFDLTVVAGSCTLKIVDSEVVYDTVSCICEQSMLSLALKSTPVALSPNASITINDKLIWSASQASASYSQDPVAVRTQNLSVPQSRSGINVPLLLLIVLIILLLITYYKNRSK